MAMSFVLLSRYYDLNLPHWTSAGQKQFQSLADELAKNQNSSTVNQALMELGATICRPLNPACLLCPLEKSCLGRKNQTLASRPLKKTPQKRELWLWSPQVITNSKKEVGLIKNNYAPFLKGHWILPGQTRLLKQKPKTYDFKHSITHHDIYVKAKYCQRFAQKKISLRWISKKSLAGVAPSNLIVKTLGQTLLLSFFLIALGCQHLETQNTKILPAVMLEHPGINEQGTFSPNGKKILFVNSKKGKEDQSQIFEMNLKKKTSKQITYQYGRTLSPRYKTRKTILYLSNTDEIQKISPLIRKGLEKLGIFENKKIPAPFFLDEKSTRDRMQIYQSDLKGENIRQLTFSLGWDGTFDIHPNKKEIVFSSAYSGKGIELYRLRLNRKRKPRRLGASAAPSQDHFPRYSPDGKILLWSRFPSASSSELLIQGRGEKSPQSLFSAPNISWHLSWHPSGRWVLFSSNKKDKNNFELYLWDLTKNCEQQLTFSEGQDLYPEFSRDGKKLIFTSDRSGSRQLYLWNFQETFKCDPEKPKKLKISNPAKSSKTDS